MDENLQGIGMIAEDMEATTANQDTGFLRGNLTDGFCLCLKQTTRGLVVLLAVILYPSHILAIKTGEVVTPQRIAGLDLLHGIFDGTESAGYLIQNLLVEQLDTQTTG